MSIFYCSHAFPILYSESVTYHKEYPDILLCYELSGFFAVAMTMAADTHNARDEALDDFVAELTRYIVVTSNHLVPRSGPCP